MNATRALDAEAAADLALCRASLRQGSRTFLAASLLLPRGVADAACALYAFCRLADDAVDGAVAGAPGLQGGASLAAAALRARLGRVYDVRDARLPANALASPADRALAAVVRRFDIPAALPHALIEGFEWDAAGRCYERLEDLHAYAARVAGSVGAMMSLLMGVRDADALARACELGVAMQLSNIARDVGEDAAMGRLYLPRAWMREAGLDPDAWLATPAFTPALGAVVERLLREADRLYARVGAGVARLPLACRPGINAARFLYAEIGQQVRRQRLDSVSRRAVVPAARKLCGLARAAVTLRPGRGPAGNAAPGLVANRFLVDAVMASGASALPLAGGPTATGAPPVAAAPRGVRQQLLGVFELFERLERREREHDRGRILGTASSA